MMPLDLSQTVVVLDLDDTLYPEVEYKKSGLRAVAEIVENLYGQSVARNWLERPIQTERDYLDELCHVAGVPLTVKQSLMWAYRLHAPNIKLSENVRLTVDYLATQCLALAVLTDGRSISQRSKLKALGLQHLPAYISEDYRSEKPEKLRYNQIMYDFPAEKYVYVGDNPQKDFLAPNRLGWQTIGLKGDNQNIHSQNENGLASEYLPKVWINRFDELGECWPYASPN